ncbi:hypothetical protein COB72_05980 [bacterium]|nr:MAG: hypothetical protein COB72_05980 [bacterium]
METHDQTNERYENAKKRTENPACRTRMFSTGLVKSGCPSCLIVGLAIMPIEMAARGVKKLVVGTDQNTLPSD